MSDQIVLPPSLAKRQSPAGSHHLGLKALFYGPPKSGKSFALASFPHPIVALACGENGIELYLQPDKGDVSIFIDSAKSYTEAFEFALKHPKVASIVIDGANLAFEDWMASWEDELKVEEIKGQHWRKVKGPWKALHRKAMLSPKNIAFSAWPKGAKYIEEEATGGIAGVEAKRTLRMVEQDTAHVEKMIPFAVDMILKTEIELDKRYAPTSIHRITYMGGRRPISIPANELHAGKFWRFDAKSLTELSPFDKVLKPIIDKWSEGAVEYVGVMDGSEATKEVGEAQTAYEDQVVGKCLARIAEMKDPKVFATVFASEIQVEMNELPDDKKAIIRAAKDAKKKELGIK